VRLGYPVDDPPRFEAPERSPSPPVQPGRPIGERIAGTLFASLPWDGYRSAEVIPIPVETPGRTHAGAWFLSLPWDGDLTVPLDPGIYEEPDLVAQRAGQWFRALPWSGGAA
jgi:hypothetical protein